MGDINYSFLSITEYDTIIYTTENRKCYPFSISYSDESAFPLSHSLAWRSLSFSSLLASRLLSPFLSLAVLGFVVLSVEKEKISKIALPTYGKKR